MCVCVYVNTNSASQIVATPVRMYWALSDVESVLQTNRLPSSMDVCPFVPTFEIHFPLWVSSWWRRNTRISSSRAWELTNQGWTHITWYCRASSCLSFGFRIQSIAFNRVLDHTRAYIYIYKDTIYCITSEKQMHCRVRSQAALTNIMLELFFCTPKAWCTCPNMWTAGRMMVSTRCRKSGLPGRGREGMEWEGREKEVEGGGRREGGRKGGRVHILC